MIKGSQYKMFILPYVFIGFIVVNLAKTEIIKRKSSRMNVDGSCRPNSYVPIDCNICKCDAAGRVDLSHCTNRECKDGGIASKGSRRMNFQGSCEAKTWYSLAPCQFCYCVDDNKLVCSTGNSQKDKNLELGMYNMSVCGQHLIKEVLELIPEGRDALREGQSKQNNQGNLINPETKPDTAFQSQNQGNNNEPIGTNNELNKDQDTKNENYDKESESESGYSLETTAKKVSVPTQQDTPSTPELKKVENEKSNESEEPKPEKPESNYNEKNHLKEEHKKNMLRTKLDQPILSIQVNHDENTESPAPSDSSLLSEGIVRLKLPAVINKLLQMSLRRSVVDDDELMSAENSRYYEDELYD